MEIIRENNVTDTTLEKFADSKGLSLTVAQQNWGIQAKFDGFWIKNGCMLEGAYGRGKTEEEAIEDYRRKISEKMLVKDWPEPRIELYVPKLLSVR